MKIFVLFLSLVLVLSSTKAQFKVEDYKKYLESRTNMTYEQLLDEYPAGKFLSSAPVDFSKADFSTNVKDFLEMTPYEESLINKNGFMVTGKYSPMSFLAAYYEIYKKDLPVYISADAILNAMHYSFNKIMEKLEEICFLQEVTKILDTLSTQSEYFHKLNKPSLDTIYLRTVKDFDIFINVGRNLVNLDVNKKINPYFPENKTTIEEIQKIIDKEEPIEIKLYSSTERLLDFSQFKPRGRYTRSEKLKAYFRTMMWLGYIEIMINDAVQHVEKYKQKEIDLRRQTLLAAMISIAAKRSNALSMIDSLELSMRKLIGTADNITIQDFLDVFEKFDQWDITQWSEKGRSEFLRYHCSQINSGKQLYNSQILFSNGKIPEQIQPSTAFKLFGQRPILDGYITSNTVYDRILFQNKKICRLFPSTFDILFSLGNDACLQLMEVEINLYKYASNLASLRYLINGYDSTFWQSSIYTNWLSSIKALNPPVERKEFPLFMQTAAWWQKTMNTQLASWSQLRHDFILYAKQPYTAGELCSFPYQFVEPVPLVYRNSIKVFENLNEILNRYINNDDWERSYKIRKCINFCNNYIEIVKKLDTISLKVLQGETLNKLDTFFLKSMISTSGCVKTLEGWYPKLYYGYDYFQASGNDFDFSSTVDLTVADYHTVPTDCYGILIGYVCHAGVGYPNYAAVVWKNPEGKEIAYTGAVYSYYEHTTINFQRLTDEEWEGMFSNKPPLKPSFTHLFSSNEKGADPGNKISLFTYDFVPSGIKENIDISSDRHDIFAYPNPCRDHTKILFRLNTGDILNEVEISVYDMNGIEVYKSNKTTLPSGNYIYLLDLKDKEENELPTGIYLITLKIGNKVSSVKVSLER